ncbi:MAG: hypothetical protein JWR89_5226 [Tardiphaga sp.]|nr:hypothetical protein [Tardiphaga sp.]
MPLAAGCLAAAGIFRRSSRLRWGASAVNTIWERCGSDSRIDRLRLPKTHRSGPSWTLWRACDVRHRSVRSRWSYKSFASNNLGATIMCSSWSIVHWFGFLSGRQRRIDVPWRNRQDTSTTNFGLTGCHSEDRAEDHRLGRPGTFAVKLREATIATSRSGSAGLSTALIAEQKPTW